MTSKTLKFFSSLLAAGALFAGTSHADTNKGAPTYVTTAAESAMVDQLIDALISAGAKNVAPANASYEVYHPNRVYTERSTSAAAPGQENLVLSNSQGDASVPLAPAVGKYLDQLFYQDRGCSGSLQPALSECVRITATKASSCTVQYYCLTF